MSRIPARYFSPYRIPSQHVAWPKWIGWAFAALSFGWALWMVRP